MHETIIIKDQTSETIFVSFQITPDTSDLTSGACAHVQFCTTV